MASNFIGINRGQDQVGLVAVSTTTPARDIELRVDTGKGSTKEDLVKALRIFEQYVLSNGVPGIGAGTDLPPL
ncbi:MAG TPA: hypothetical protein VFA81_10680 [Burkholderiales bacterium]|nr:hypothetical protein [Burkholderiales bacterium]